MSLILVYEASLILVKRDLPPRYDLIQLTEKPVDAKRVFKPFGKDCMVNGVKHCV